VVERVDVEVGPQLPVEHVQHVAVELGGDPGRVVIGGHERRRVDDEPGAEQELLAGPHRRPQRPQELRALRRKQVADRAAEERDHPMPLRR
jgi:hypothetical protein